MLFLPELVLLFGALGLFVLSLGTPKSTTVRYCAITLGSLVLLASIASLWQDGVLFFGTYQVDLFSQVFKVLVSGGTLIVLIFSGRTPGIKEDVTSEYYLFLFIGVLGLVMLISSVELLAVFISLELSSFAVYIMVPMRQTETSAGYQMESGIKYLLFGIMATGFMLFGMSYIFGLTGSTYFAEIIPALEDLYNQPAAVAAMLMVMVGFFYKLAIFPFHFWVPDVYEGAANETTAFIAAVPKIAAVALLIRFVSMLSVDGTVVVNLLLMLALASMFYGNLSALAQKDVKRLLGYSGISHAGFVLFGLLTLQPQGYSIAFYYIIGYAVMTLACFLVICVAAPNGENLEINSLTGLHKRSPLFALTLAIGLFALAGIPPFVGFTGKFMLLVNALKNGHTIPVILAAINTAIAIYYYLSIVRVAYCTDPHQETMPINQEGALTYITSIALLVIIVVMGVAPTAFLKLASTTIGTIL